MHMWLHSVGEIDCSVLQQRVNWTDVVNDVRFVAAISPTTETGSPCLEVMALECSTGVYSLQCDTSDLHM